MDISITDLWLTIVACGVATFFGSFVTWALSPHHRKDWKPLADEEGFRAALGTFRIPPGTYMFPMARTDAEQRSTEYQNKFKQGPSGQISIWPQPNMGKNLALTFLVFLVASFFIAYIAAETLDRGAVFQRVFQITTTLGLIAYCFSYLPNAIWFNWNRRAVVTHIADGIFYGIITGLVFAFMWPK